MRGVVDAGARLDFQQVPAHDVAHDGLADPVPAGRQAVRVDVPVQHKGGLEARGEPAQRAEPLMRRVFALPGAGRRRVREQYIDAAAVPEPAPSGAPGQGAGPPGCAWPVLVAVAGTATAPTSTPSGSRPGEPAP